MYCKASDIDSLSRGRAAKTRLNYWCCGLDAQYYQRRFPAWYCTTISSLLLLTTLILISEHGHDHGPVTSPNGIELENVHAPRSATEASFDAAVC